MTVTRPRRFVAVTAFTLAGAACGGDDIDATAPRSARGSAVTIVAKDTAFDKTTIDAKSGEPLTITYDNRDEAITHNLHVKGATGGDAMTDIEAGPITQTLEVTFGDAGQFEYLCDVHPQQMTGTITVSP